MKIVFVYIGLIFLLLILALSIWNIIYLRHLKNDINRTGNYPNEYFELRSRLQLISTIGSIIAAIIIFYGYNSENMIKTFVNTSVTISLQKNDSIIERKYNEKLQGYLNRISSTENEINKISNKEIINADIYIVNNYKVKTSLAVDRRFRIYYKDLPPTLSGKKLPRFTKPPVINLIATNGSEFLISDITKDYFEFKIISNFYETSSFDLWFAL